MGVVLVTQAGNELEYAIRFGFKTTNNEVEYEVMLTRLCLSYTLEAKQVRVNSNYQLMVGLLQGEYEAKDERIKQYHTLVVKEKSRFEHFSI